MENVKLYKHEVGRSKQDLEQCLEHLEGLGFHTRFDSIEKQHNARKRIGRDRECHVVIRKIKSGKYRAYLHIDVVVSDMPLVHRALHDPDETKRWGEKIFGAIKKLPVPKVVRGKIGLYDKKHAVKFPKPIICGSLNF